MYYNVSITKWLSATADLQIIDPRSNRHSARPRGYSRGSQMSTPPLCVDAAFVSDSRSVHPTLEIFDPSIPAPAMRPF
jgi:hypothetical protein